MSIVRKTIIRMEIKTRPGFLWLISTQSLYSTKNAYKIQTVKARPLHKIKAQTAQIKNLACLF
jgi:hypothetical protein